MNPPPATSFSTAFSTSFDRELASQVHLSRTQLADGLARGDEALVESASARLAELDDLRVHHAPEALPLDPALGRR